MCQSLVRRRGVCSRFLQLLQPSRSLSQLLASLAQLPRQLLCTLVQLVVLVTQTTQYGALTLTLARQRVLVFLDLAT